jgi:uncharacterized membrane protein required for colicin V production
MTAFFAFESPTSSPLRWLDLFGLALVVLFAIVGARGGLWWQFLRLLGLVATIAVARAVAPRFAAVLRGVFEGLDARVSEGLAWSVLFGCGLLVVALVGRLGKTAAGAPEPLTWFDRAGGLCAGAVSGALLHAAFLLCLGHFAAPEWAAARVRGSHSQQWIAALGHGVPGLVDAHAARTLGVESEE